MLWGKTSCRTSFASPSSPATFKATERKEKEGPVWLTFAIFTSLSRRWYSVWKLLEGVDGRDDREKTLELFGRWQFLTESDRCVFEQGICFPSLHSANEISLSLHLQTPSNHPPWLVFILRHSLYRLVWSNNSQPPRSLRPILQLAVLLPTSCNTRHRDERAFGFVEEI